MSISKPTIYKLLLIAEADIYFPWYEKYCGSIIQYNFVFQYVKETEVHITYEDQQKINRFARLNAKYEDFKEEIQGRKVRIKDL